MREREVEEWLTWLAVKRNPKHAKRGVAVGALPLQTSSWGAAHGHCCTAGKETSAATNGAFATRDRFATSQYPWFAIANSAIDVCGGLASW